MLSENGGERCTTHFGAVPGRNSSLGLLAAHRLDLLLSCDVCEHWADVPIQEAIARYGERADYEEVHGLCTACGSRRTTVRTCGRLPEHEPPVGIEHLLVRAEETCLEPV